MQRKLGFRLSFNQASRANLKDSRGTNNAGRGFNARLGPPPSGKLFPNLAPTLPPRRGRLLTWALKGICKDEAAASTGMSNGRGISYYLSTPSTREFGRSPS